MFKNRGMQMAQGVAQRRRTKSEMRHSTTRKNRKLRCIADCTPQCATCRQFATEADEDAIPTTNAHYGVRSSALHAQIC